MAERAGNQHTETKTGYELNQQDLFDFYACPGSWTQFWNANLNIFLRFQQAIQVCLSMAFCCSLLMKTAT